MSSISSMLPMLLVIGLAVVAFIKRCDFLPELCNPSQTASAIPPATVTGAPLLTWDDYKKAAKEQKKDSDRDEETRKAAEYFTKKTGRAIPVANAIPPSSTSTAAGTSDLESFIRRAQSTPQGTAVSKFARVSYI